MELIIEKVSKQYGKGKALDNYSARIEINKGNVVGLVGPNGAGKTTLMKILAGILDYQDGMVHIDNKSKSDYEKWCKQNVAFVSAGERGLKYKNTVLDNVIYFCALKGIDKKVTQSRYNEYARLLNFEDFASRRIETLSTGELKKVNLLCGLCTGTKVILLDEPSSGLDIDAVEELKKSIEIISREIQSTLLISSHDIDFLSKTTNIIHFILKGKSVYQSNSKMKTEEIVDKYNEMKGAYHD